MQQFREGEIARAVPNLTRLFAPKRIAIAGGGTWGDLIASAADRIKFDGELIPVHPKGKIVAGRTSVRSVREIDGPVDAAFVCVNRHATIDVVRDLAAHGCGGAVCFASGFAEAIEEDSSAADLQAELVAAAGKMPVLGPNCYGFVNALDRAAIWPDQHGMEPIDRGVAILTQSSNIAINLTMQQRALPIAMAVTCGNMAQTSQADIARNLVRDSRISAIGLHIEGFGDLRAWEALAREAWDAGVPLIALKVGASDAAQHATQSHTASLAGSDAGAQALLDRLGIARAVSVTDFLETLKILHVAGRLPSRSLASISCSGGEASLVADLAQREGLDCPDLSTAQRSELRDILGPLVSLANPLDYHTYIWRDTNAMGRAWGCVSNGEAAITMSIVDYPHTDARDWRCATDAAMHARQMSGKPFAMVASLPELMPADVAAELLTADVIPMNGLHDALRAIRIAASTHAPILHPALAQPGAARDALLIPEDTAKAALAGHGITIPRQFHAPFPDQDRFVVKGLGLAHKSEAGAVRLNVFGKDVTDVARDIGTDRILVEEMISDGIAELLIGVVRDPAHGFVLTLGAGGVLTEILSDTVSVLVPTPVERIKDQLEHLKVYGLLTGFRGKPSADMTSVLAVIDAVQDYVLANLDTLEEIEINPLIVTPSRAVAVDALIRKAQT